MIRDNLVQASQFNVHGTEVLGNPVLFVSVSIGRGLRYRIGNVGGQAFERRGKRSGGERQTEPSDIVGVASIVSLIESKGQFRAARKAHRFLRLENGHMAFAEFRTNGPSVRRIVVDGLFHLPIVLREIGFCGCQFNCLRGFLAAGWRRGDTERRQHKVSVVRSAGAFLDEARVGKNLHSNRRHALGSNDRLDGVNIGYFILPSCEPRRIVLSHQRCTVLGRGGNRLDCLPDNRVI